jgi:hypothetical protein
MFSPVRGGVTHDTLEHDCEMGLRSEPKQQRDVDDRHRRISKQGLGMGDFSPEDVMIRRIAGCYAKLSSKMHARKASDVAEFNQVDWSQ